ncbi:MAG TPA: hypothetical protein VHT29_09185 [Solirubrobacteraceae bacterium]|nr:hypothetical protein [Solirubrobacteraceae bacterium]
MRVVAEHLRLPPEHAPNVVEFRQAASETELPMSFRAAHAAFDKRWELAQRFYQELPIPKTAAQRRAMSQRRKDFQDVIVGLRLWASETLPTSKTRQADYRDWAEEMNEKNPPEWRRVRESPNGICEHLEASWPQVIAVARGEKTVEEARRDTKEEGLREAGPLIGRVLVRQMLGLPARGGELWEPDFPEPFFWLHEQPLWLVSDVRAYMKGQRDFTHHKGELQHAYMDDHDVARALGIEPDLLRQRMRDKTSGVYTRIPPPAGKYRHRCYWERAAVEEWVRALANRRRLSGIPLRQASRGEKRGQSPAND